MLALPHQRQIIARRRREDAIDRNLQASLAALESAQTRRDESTPNSAAYARAQQHVETLTDRILLLSGQVSWD